MDITTMKIQTLTQENALIIADNWKYEGIYAFYNATNDQEDYDELIDPAKRQDHFYECLIDYQLIGYCVIEKEDKTIHFGLGLAPFLTGKHLGQSFIEEIEKFIKQQHTDITTIELAVVTFNQRAYKVYKKCGYQEIGTFNMPSNGSTYRFIKMKKDV